MREILAALTITLTMALGGVSAAGQLGGAVNTVKQAGEVTKDVGKTAGEATKEGAKKAGEATKEGAKTAKSTVTGKAHAKCADGTTQTGKNAKAAKAGCAKHGGVAK